MQNFKNIVIFIMIFGTNTGNFSDSNSEEQYEESASNYEQHSDKDTGEQERNKRILRQKESINEIKTRLCLHIFMKNLNDNTVCSGLNVILLLGKLAPGAEGLTKREIMRALGVSDIESLTAKLQKILFQLRTEHGAEIRLATFLYVNDMYPVKDSYRNRIMDIYGNSVTNIEFNRTSAATHLINTWVKNSWPRKDKRVVKDLISEDELHSWTPLVLVSTMLFKGIWPVQFPHKEMREFTTVNKGIVETEMIKQRGIFNYTFSEYFDSEIIMLPLNSVNSFYVLVLPFTTDGLEKLIYNIIHYRDYFIDSLEHMTEEYVEVTLPRMGITTSQDLYSLLHMIEVQDMFNETADFTGISSKKGIYVSVAKQKIRLVFTEEGENPQYTEKVHTGNMTLLSFVADRPFYFMALINGRKVLSGICTEPAKLLKRPLG